MWQLLLFGIVFYYKNDTLYQIINMQMNRLVQYIGLLWETLLIMTFCEPFFTIMTSQRNIYLNRKKQIEYLLKCANGDWLYYTSPHLVIGSLSKARYVKSD